MGGPRRKIGEISNAFIMLIIKPKQNNHLKDLGVDGNTTLKYL